MTAGVVSRLARAAVHCGVDAFAREAAFLGVAGVLFAVAVVAALVAGYQALATVWEPYWAAFAIAGTAFVVAALTLGLRAFVRRPSTISAGESPADLLAEILGSDGGEFAQAALDEAEAQYRKDPAGFLVVAVAAGFIAGILPSAGRR